VLLSLTFVMATTRFEPLSKIAHLQDASWAVFFLAGFYLSAHWCWVFPVLFAEAVLIDYVAIGYLGISNYCVTWAYWCLVPSYALLWLSGKWLHRHQSADSRGIICLAVSLGIALSLCFLVSNASFYWLGERVAQRAWDGWLLNLTDWYWPMILVPLAYVATIAFIHAIAHKSGALVSRQPVP
jgi:hypothetical protein